MAQYLTFDEYTDVYGCTTITNAAVFDDLEFGAEALIDYYTFNRLRNETEYPERLQRLVIHLIHLAYQQAAALSLGATDGTSDSTATGPYITSQSNDGVSVSYSNMNSADLYSACSAEAAKSVRRYLSAVMNSAGQKLLYRGLYEGE